MYIQCTYICIYNVHIYMYIYCTYIYIYMCRDKNVCIYMVCVAPRSSSLLFPGLPKWHRQSAFGKRRLPSWKSTKVGSNLKRYVICQKPQCLRDGGTRQKSRNQHSFQPPFVGTYGVPPRLWS